MDDAVFKSPLVIRYLPVVYIGERTELNPRILCKAAAHDGAPASKTYDAETDSIVGANDGSIGLARSFRALQPLRPPSR